MLELTVGELPDPSLADNLVELFKEIVDLGTIEPLDGGQASDGMRRFHIKTSSSDDDLLDLFTFHVAREQVQLLPLGPGYGFHAGNPGAPAAEPAAPAAPAKDPGYGFFDDAPGAPNTQAAASPAVQIEPVATSATAAAAPAEAPKAAPPRAAATPTPPHPSLVARQPRRVFPRTARRPPSLTLALVTIYKIIRFNTRMLTFSLVQKT